MRHEYASLCQGWPETVPRTADVATRAAGITPRDPAQSCYLRERGAAPLWEKSLSRYRPCRLRPRQEGSLNQSIHTDPIVLQDLACKPNHYRKITANWQ